MDGKALRPNECAAILQPFAEALRDLVPLDLIEHDRQRYLEGARLLFGFILQQGESISTKTNPPHGKNEEDEMPYLDCFKTIDLRDVRTDEAIVDLVQTNFGLMERGCFAAFQPGGTLAQLGMANVDILPVSLDPPSKPFCLTTPSSRTRSKNYEYFRGIFLIWRRSVTNPA
jgi:hypothetical protein